MHCIQCGAEAGGRFCGDCGASLRDTPCPACGREERRGRRYCTGCGSRIHAAPVEGTPGGGAGGGGHLGSNAGWWVSGVLLVALIVVTGSAALRSADPPAGAGAPPGGSPGALGPAPEVDLASMTPREAADRLFERVMRGLEREDTTEVASFLPMAVDAYELARPLDEDGLFHLSLLQRVGSEYEAALATAREALETHPDHLLNLSAAAEAATELGREAAAREYFGRMLEAWDRELEAARPEYDEHAPLLPIIRRNAEELLGSEGR